MTRDLRSSALLALVLLTALSARPAGQGRSAKVRTSPQTNATMLKEIRRTVMGDIVRVVIELEAEVAYHSERVENPARVLFDLESTRVGPALAEGTLSYPTDIVRHIRIGRHPNRVVRVVLDLEGVKRYSVFTLYSPYRIIVDCERGPVLPPVPSERITEEKVRPPIADPGDAPSPVKTAVASPVNTDFAARKPAPLSTPAASSTPAAPPGPAAVPARSRTLASRAVVRGHAALAPRIAEPPLVRLPPPGVAAATTTAPAAATTLTRTAAAPTRPLIPLKTTRQYRSTRYPTWQPVVLPPDLRGTRLTAAAPAVSAAVSPAVAEKTTAAEARGGADKLGKAVIATEPVTPPPNGFSMARQLGLGAARIVIDPGHGGHDPGAGGPRIYEAHIVLDIALRLEKLLTAAGIEAVLTRRTDEYVPLEERTAIANRAHGDLFLSIHANASRNRAARGIESYVLNFASTPDAEAVAARENASTGLTMSSLTEIVKAIALNNKLDESRTFAGVIQREMANHLRASNKDVKNLGVKQAPFVVLIGASMPSVLVEISFITHAQEGRLLKTGAYRQKIAESLFDAIRGYQQSLKGASVLTRQ